MSCTYGNCNDANCVAGSDTDVNGNPCDDATCPPCGTQGLVAAGGTMAPSPSVPNAPAAASANSLTSMTNAMGQWGATIASIATGTPTVVTSSGAKVGTAASTATALTSSPMTILLLLGVVVIVLVMMEK
jgi:hypothetical protein